MISILHSSSEVRFNMNGPESDFILGYMVLILPKVLFF